MCIVPCCTCQFDIECYNHYALNICLWLWLQACHMHAGYVLDQEGDSWAVAFHDADDAVAFSLQVRCGD
jgi:hypothetical protein